MKIIDVKARAEAAGLVALEQRGFYSHFMRIRTRDYQTLGLSTSTMMAMCRTPRLI